MSEGTVEVFFYGLFMDEGVLREAGTNPSRFRRAYINDFSLRIGRRATLTPLPGARSYGMLVSLTPADLERLYAAPGLEGYRPEELLVQAFAGDPVPALCYNLPNAPGPEERNPDYAERLKAVLEGLGFPAAYLESIE